MAGSRRRFWARGGSTTRCAQSIGRWPWARSPAGWSGCTVSARWSLDNLARYEEAITEAERALALDPESDNAHFIRACALHALGRLEEARSASTQAIALDPEIPRYQRQLGDLWLRDDAPLAEQHYRAALALDPNDVGALVNLSLALLRQHRNADAAVAARSAMRLDPADPDAQLNLRTAVRRVRSPAPMVFAVTIFLGVPALLLVGGAWLLRGHLALLVTEATLGAGLMAVLVATVTSSRRRHIASLHPEITSAYESLEAERRGAGRTLQE